MKSLNFDSTNDLPNPMLVRANQVGKIVLGWKQIIKRARSIIQPNPLLYLVRLAGFEPATYGL